MHLSCVCVHDVDVCTYLVTFIPQAIFGVGRPSVLLVSRKARLGPRRSVIVDFAFLYHIVVSGPRNPSVVKCSAHTRTHAATIAKHRR